MWWQGRQGVIVLNCMNAWSKKYWHTWMKLIERKSKLFVLLKERLFILFLKHLGFHVFWCMYQNISIYIFIWHNAIWPLITIHHHSSIPHPTPDLSTTSAVEEACWNKSILVRLLSLNRGLKTLTACCGHLGLELKLFHKVFVLKNVLRFLPKSKTQRHSSHRHMNDRWPAEVGFWFKIKQMINWLSEQFIITHLTNQLRVLYPCVVPI